MSKAKDYFTLVFPKNHQVFKTINDFEKIKTGHNTPYKKLPG